jgi:hypothetical protein
MENQTGTVAVKKGTKTEAELIATVANIHDADRCFLFAQRAREAGLLELVAACEERAKHSSLTRFPPPTRHQYHAVKRRRRK